MTPLMDSHVIVSRDTQVTVSMVTEYFITYRKINRVALVTETLVPLVTETMGSPCMPCLHIVLVSVVTERNSLVNYRK